MDNEKDYGAFFVSENVLDGISKVEYVIREELAIPIANGFQLFAEGDKEFELVTIHTIHEVFPEIENFLDSSYGSVFKIEYENNNYKGFLQEK